jgi:predicted Na+-dependent transporter
LDSATHHAIQHTLHCLFGCGIGEVLGSAIGAGLQWPNIWQTLLSIVLAFTFGYGITFRGARRMGMDAPDARRTAFRTDTISISCMELIDNLLLVWIIPGAMNAHVVSWLFWGSLALSLGIAFLVTVPVNRFMMVRFGIGHMHTGNSR